MHSLVSFRRFVTIVPVVMFIAPMLAGCAQDPMTESNGSWHESNVVWQNLAAQVADSHDLVAGHGDNSLLAEPLIAPIAAWSNTKPPTPTVAPETSLSNLATP